MKFARLMLAVLAIATAAACSSDITSPDRQPSAANFDDGQGTYGPPGAKNCGLDCEP